MKDQLSKLKNRVGLKAFAALRRGAILHCWRCSSPHNWWVENRKGDMLWHSDGWGDRPDISMFLVKQHSGRLIASSWIHSDGGRPESSEYVLKPEFLVRTPKRRKKSKGRK